MFPPELPYFSWYNIPKREKYIKLPKIYQIGIKYNNWPQNRPNGLKMYHHLPFQNPTKLTQIGICGLKIYHLETLAPTCNAFCKNPTSLIQSLTGFSVPKSIRTLENRYVHMY
jgi:hypothetical protein